jgi:hypothetical protein
MEDLSIYTPTELLKLINDTKDKHEQMKIDIANMCGEVEKWEKLINEKIEKLGEIENKYVLLIEEMTKRQ